MTETYLQYWGLVRHPFLMAPDSGMMYVAGQYYECLERLKYAVNTRKGGALLISEDAGLGKTTVLLKLIDGMKKEYGDSFRYALVDHPTLTDNQIVAHIAASISGETAFDDKLKNLTLLKEALIDVQKRGGKSIIVVDEGQMLCEAKHILQELRVLINLTHENDYLHTFILSGQRALWNTIKGMPEFWQRLPVRYFLIPLQLDETRGLVRHRLQMAGAKEEEREIFTDDALDIIHRYSKGSPRTIIALADLALLVGYTDKVQKVGFKEVSRAMAAMSGQGESLPYVKKEEARDQGKDQELSLRAYSTVSRTGPTVRNQPDQRRTVEPPDLGGSKPFLPPWIRPRHLKGALIVAVLIAGALGYFYALSVIFDGGKRAGPEKPAATLPGPSPVAPRADPKIEPKIESPPEKREIPPTQADTPRPSDVPKTALPPVVPVGPSSPGDQREKSSQVFREGVVSVDVANVRESPDLGSLVVAQVERGVRVRITDDTEGNDDSRWFRVLLKYDREGWINQRLVVELRTGGSGIRVKRGPR